MRIINLPMKLIAGGVVALLLAALVGALMTSQLGAHGGDTNQIHTCTHDKVGVVKIVESAEECPTGWASLDWAIKGPQGPQGPVGPTGGGAAPLIGARPTAATLRGVHDTCSLPDASFIFHTLNVSSANEF